MFTVVYTEHKFGSSPKYYKYIHARHSHIYMTYSTPVSLCTRRTVRFEKNRIKYVLKKIFLNQIVYGPMDLTAYNNRNCKIILTSAK